MRTGFQALRVTARLAIAVSVLLICIPVGRAAEPLRVVALASHNVLPYQESLSGFERALRQQYPELVLETYVLGDKASREGQLLAAVRSERTRLVLTLGTGAADWMVKNASAKPVVAGMILSADELRGLPNSTGVLLEFPVDVQLQWLRRMLPGQRAVGVLFNPRDNAGLAATAGPAARSQQLTLHALEVAEPRDLPDALDRIARRADVLWGIPDQTVLTPETAKTILLFSFRNKIPLVGLSASWTKAGAIYSLDRDYGDIGRQCAELAARVISGTAPAAIPVAAPRTVLYSVNLRTAQSMKLELAPDLVRHAAQVFE